MMKAEHEKRLQAIEKRLRAAGTGEWKPVNETPQYPRIGRWEVRSVTDWPRTDDPSQHTHVASLMHENEAYFIAGAREDIPWLIERLREAERNERPRCDCDDPVNVHTNDTDTCGRCRYPIR